MARIPIRVLLFAAEPSQGTYLEAILGMEAPGMFEVRHCDSARSLRRAALEGEGVDLLLLAIDADACAEDALPDLPHGPARAPAIVVCPWLPSLPGTARLIRAGAEDVLGLAELNPRRLVASVLKVLERRWRPAQPTLHAAMHEGPVRASAGLHSWTTSEPWIGEAPSA